jgi:hypothetical protein
MGTTWWERRDGNDMVAAFTRAHGQWSVFTTGGGCKMMTLIFDGLGRDDVEKLTIHLFYEVCGKDMMRTT